MGQHVGIMTHPGSISSTTWLPETLPGWLWGVVLEPQDLGSTGSLENPWRLTCYNWEWPLTLVGSTTPSCKPQKVYILELRKYD